MFSTAEKMKIAAEVERLLLELNHPEMPGSKPEFELIVKGKESWSFAHISPNWKFSGIGYPPNPNPWNEIALEILKQK